MANALGLDVWINVPVLSTDDYVCRMARLFKYGEQGDKSNGACDPAAAAGAATTAKLAPTSKVYVELSNEIWNAGFHQIHDVYCMIWGKTDNGSFPCDVTKPTSAIAAADLANPRISWSTDMGTKATQLAVFLGKRDSTIFRTVFGCSLTSGTGCQAQIPFNVQSAYAAEVEPGFALLKKTDGSLAALDAMAVAPLLQHRRRQRGHLGGRGLRRPRCEPRHRAGGQRGRRHRQLARRRSRRGQHVQSSLDGLRGRAGG